MTLPRPDRRAAPEAFYRDYLPGLWRAIAGELAFPRWRFDLTFHVGGVTHGLSFDAGELQSGATVGTPLLAIHCDAAAWRLANLEVLPQVLRRLEPRLGDLRRVLARMLSGRVDPARLRTVPGVLEVHYTDDAGDTGAYCCDIAGGGGPRVKLTARDADLWPLLEARGRLADLLRSRLQIDGDAGYLLRLLTAFEPPK